MKIDSVQIIFKNQAGSPWNKLPSRLHAQPRARAGCVGHRLRLPVETIIALLELPVQTARLASRYISRIKVLVIEPPAHICLVAIVQIYPSVCDQVIRSQAMVLKLRIVGGEVTRCQVRAIIDKGAL